MSEDPLRRIVERNRERWRRRQRTRKGGWSHFIITAANPRQARGYELQMEHREREGRWPGGTNWRVVPDPVGKRIGSGLATLHALVQLGQRRPGEKTLVLHCGGSSVRMPHCSAFGKVFAPLPVEIAPGWCSTIFDENVALLNGLAQKAGEGVVAAAGDVLVALDPLAVDFTPKSVVAVTVSVPARRGEGHGVFVAERPNGQVRRILQKFPAARLREEGAVDSGGRVLIDTGIFYLPPSLVSILLAEVSRAGSPLLEALKVGGEMDLYTDFSEALASETPREDYLQTAGDRPDDLRRRLRQRLWELLHDRFPLYIAYLSPGAFFHLGSTADYVHGLRPETEVGKAFGFERCVASPSVPGGGAATLVSCSLGEGKARGKVGRGALLENCALWGKYSVGRDSLASGLGGRGEPVRLRAGLAAFSVPLAFPNGFRIAALAGREAWATAVYGIDDNPKASVTSAQATFMNQPLLRWLSARSIAPEDVWPEDLPPCGRTLWTARLFPAEVGSRSTGWLEWFQMSAQRTRARRGPWGAQPRLSLAEVFEMADCEKLADRGRTSTPLAPSLDGTFQQVSEVLRRGEDANIESLYKDFRTPAQFLRLKSTLDQLVLSLPCAIRRARVFKVAADMMADERFAQTQQKEARPAASLTPVDDRAMLRLWGHAYEELAFANVRLAIEASVPTPRQKAARRLLPGISLRVEVPARIDLGGGWSDTPPYSLERGGAVVNFALTLDGQCPVVAWGKTLPQPILRLGSLDLGVTQEITDLEHMGTYDDVEDPLALLKAAAVFEGIVPREAAGPVKAHMQRLGAGVELITECRLPKGSGMGTSSILAAAAVAALTGLRGLRLSVKELFNHVLCVEQMMTTGGGWQDQVGGAVGGIKYVHTTADAPFSPRIEKIKLPAAILQEFNERLVVYYTGHNRLAKNILRQIMGDYLSRRQPVFQTLHEIRATADQLREAFHSRDLNAVGRRMSQSWELNKRLNPTTSNERIDALFAVAAPYIAGGKLAGAGGGGFMALLAKDRASAEHLRKILRGLAMGTEQRLYNAAVDMTGIRVRAE